MALGYANGNFARIEFFTPVCWWLKC